MPRLLRALFVATFTVCGAAHAAAQVTRPAPEAAAIAVHARVVALRSAWTEAPRTIVTYVELDVIERLRGTGLPPRLVLKQLGGQVDDIGLFIAGQAAFQPGENALLYLSAAHDGTLHTAGLDGGKHVATAAALAAARVPVTSAPSARPVVPVPPEYDALMRSPSPLFAFLNTGGQPARWHQVDDNTPVFVDAAGLPATWTHAAPANVTAAVNLWRGSGMDLDLRQGAAFTGTCAADFTGNGRIAISFNDPCGGVSDWVVGGGYYTTGDLRTVNGYEFQKFIQGFLVLNDTGVQATATGCFQDAVTHGLGHALGLGHSSASAMMEPNPRAACTTAAGGLTSDDLNGITTIYEGIPSATAPPNPPSAFTASSVLNTVALSWTPATTGGAVQQYLVDAGTASGIYNLGSATFPATVTTTSVPAVPAGVYYLRVRARNALGTSAPSVERAVTVGACTPPGPPGTLSGTATDTRVNLLWSAPTTGVAQGYRVLAGTAPGVANLGSTDYPATVTALAGTVPYGTYYVRVQALNVCGVSAPSNEVAVVVAPCTAAPQAPTGLTVVKNGTFLTFSWTAPAGTPPTSYTFAVGSAPGASNLVVSPTGTTSTSLAGNAPNGAYYVRVHAQNACGQSAPSNEIFVTVP